MGVSSLHPLAVSCGLGLLMASSIPHSYVQLTRISFSHYSLIVCWHFMPGSHCVITDLSVTVLYCIYWGTRYPCPQSEDFEKSTLVLSTEEKRFYSIGTGTSSWDQKTDYWHSHSMSSYDLLTYFSEPKYTVLVLYQSSRSLWKFFSRSEEGEEVTTSTCLARIYWFCLVRRLVTQKTSRKIFMKDVRN